MKKPKLAHRDDLPMDVVEDLEKKFQELYPGMKVTFAGDAPAGKGPPPEVLEALSAALAKRGEESLLNGTCIDCGAKMPGEYLPNKKKGWQPAEGWSYFSTMDSTGGSDGFMGWQCPACEEAEEDGVPRPLNLPMD